MKGFPRDYIPRRQNPVDMWSPVDAIPDMKIALQELCINAGVGVVPIHLLSCLNTLSSVPRELCSAPRGVLGGAGSAFSKNACDGSAGFGRRASDSGHSSMGSDPHLLGQKQGLGNQVGPYTAVAKVPFPFLVLFLPFLPLSVFRVHQHGS